MPQGFDTDSAPIYSPESGYAWRESAPKRTPRKRTHRTGRSHAALAAGIAAAYGTRADRRAEDLAALESALESFGADLGGIADSAIAAMRVA